MSDDDNNKVEPAGQEEKAAELTDKDLEQVAGGAGTTEVRGLIKTHKEVGSM